MSDINIRTDLLKVSAIIKLMVNGLCEKGHEWYPEVIGCEKDGPNVMEVNLAIRVLDEYAENSVKEMIIIDQ